MTDGEVKRLRSLRNGGDLRIRSLFPRMPDGDRAD
jgi:hypothetical protein